MMKDGPIVVTCQAAEGRSWSDVRVRFLFLSSQNHGAVRCCHGEILTLLPGQELCSWFTSAFLSLSLGKVGMKLFTPSEVEVEELQHPKASWHRRVIKIAINTFSSLCEQCRGAGWGPSKGNSNKQTVRLQTTSSQLGSWPGRWQEGECLGSSALGFFSAPSQKHK